MTDPHPQPIDPALFEVICAKEWFEKYGASMMPGYFEARISAYKRIEKERKTATHAPAAPATFDQCRLSSVCVDVRIARKAEREKMLDALGWC